MTPKPAVLAVIITLLLSSVFAHAACLENSGGEAFRITGKGIGNDVIDLAKVDAGKLAEYIKHWRGDPLDDSAGVHKLIRMFKSVGVRTAIGDTGQWVDDVAVLKLGVKEEWGYKHIFEYVRSGGKTRAKEIQEAFGLADDNNAVLEFIQEGLEKGTKQADGNIIWRLPDAKKDLKIVMSTDSPGSIQTVMPW